MIVTAAIAPASPWVFLVPFRVLVPRKPSGVCRDMEKGQHPSGPACEETERNGRSQSPARGRYPRAAIWRSAACRLTVWPGFSACRS